MDDLEHSVVIAERDWESFYEESEECSIQQAWLASLDDSGFSDTDDKKNCTQHPVLDLQNEPEIPNKVPDAAATTCSEANDYKAENPSEEPECTSYKKNIERFADQTAEISQYAVSTCTCLTSDNGLSGYDGGFTVQQHVASESCNEDKSCPATGEPITSSQCIQDIQHHGRSEREAVLKVSESPATQKREKERWFVTVNDSPVMLKGKSGQKKRRKKKTSNKRDQQDIESESQCCVSHNMNIERRELMKDRQILHDSFMQPIQTYSESIDFNPSAQFSEVILDSNNNQDPVFSPTKETESLKTEASENPFVQKNTCTSEASSFIAEEENISCALSSKYKDNSNVPIETKESNPHASMASLSPFILSASAQLHAHAQVNYPGIANKPKSDTQITTPDHAMSDNRLSHEGHEDTQDDSSTPILEINATGPSLEKLHEEEYLSEIQEEFKWPRQETQNQQAQSLEAAVGPNCPIYSFSSFWDEMEKLTINDILHLRSTHNESPLNENFINEKSDGNLENKYLMNMTSKHYGEHESDLIDDTLNYFTQRDKCKPDSSSCEFSALCDFDEEFLQTLNKSENSSTEPQVKEQTEHFEATYILGRELEPNNESESLDSMKLCAQDGILHCLYTTTEVQSLFSTSSQDINGNPFELEIIRKTPASSFGNSTDNQSTLTFSEVSSKDMNGAAASSDRLNSIVVSFPFTQNLSVCEIYDRFSSDIEVGDFFFPSTQNKTVPIFSVSHSLVRDLVFPEVGELDFDPDFEEDNMPIRNMNCFSNQPEMSTNNPGVPNLCLLSQRGNWSNLFSLRRTKFTGNGSTWHHKVSSRIPPTEPKKVKAYASRVQQIDPLMQMERKSLCHLAEPEKHAVCISRKKDFMFSINQADMCLICIAFASWVLKSSNFQSTHTWKAALLANASAISAIQYLRKYGKGHR